MIINLAQSEISVVRRALGQLYEKFVTDNYPERVIKDLDAFRRWKEQEEINPDSDLNKVVSIRNKLLQAERTEREKLRVPMSERYGNNLSQFEE